MRLPWQPQDDSGVADTVGSILMVAITVVMSVILGGVLLAFKGPVALAHADVAITVDPGSDGAWGTGNEFIRLTHRGGDFLAASDSTMRITVGSTTRTLTGTAQLGSAWTDGFLRIGETWTYVWPVAGGIPAGAAVSVGLVKSSGQSQLVSSASLVASAVAATNPCVTDTAMPTVTLWGQSPAIITGFTTGAITITAQLGDNCWGVDPAVVPRLYWRITPTASFTDQGTMTNIGPNTWRGTVPSQTWSSLVGRSLVYHIGPLRDVGGNPASGSADSPDQTSVIQADCSSDNSAPTVQTLTQSPVDVRSSTVGSVSVTVVVADNCAGVDQASNPHLLYRFNDGSNPSFTDGGSMTRTGTSTWQSSIPSQSWALLAGRTLEYQVQGMRDLNGNTATSATYQDIIDALFTYTYANSNTPTTGSVVSFTNCCSAGAGTDSGLEAAVIEGASSGSPVTVTFNGNAVTSANGWTSATNAFASDNSYATYATSSPSTTANDLKLDLQDPVVTTGTICSTSGCGGVVLHAEVSITSFANDGFQIYACLSGGLCSAVSPTGGQSSSDVTMNYDISALRPGGGTWSWTDVANLQGAVLMTQSGTRDGTWRVDRVWVDVTSVTTTYGMNVAMGFPSVPSGSSQTLDLKYRVTGDTYNVQVCQDGLPTCLTWTTRGVTLTGTGPTTWTYGLTTAEYNLGSPRIRFTDVSPTGTTQGNLFLDYVRVATL
ncbi:MAG TPA: type IV pilin N-terminal domain-containing protein [Candidatus Thermoplasmatota archaeon]|nr:type IV pilin N-terminal domain-containing protein [Candidatus Thermoplasmatota archaeon]